MQSEESWEEKNWMVIAQLDYNVVKEGPSSWWLHHTLMIMLFILMTASYVDDDVIHFNDRIVRWWWCYSSWWHHGTVMMIFILMIASYTDDDHHRLYTMWLKFGHIMSVGWCYIHLRCCFSLIFCLPCSNNSWHCQKTLVLSIQSCLLTLFQNNGLDIPPWARFGYEQTNA